MVGFDRQGSSIEAGGTAIKVVLTTSRTSAIRVVGGGTEGRATGTGVNGVNVARDAISGRWGEPYTKN